MNDLLSNSQKSKKTEFLSTKIIMLENAIILIKNKKYHKIIFSESNILAVCNWMTKRKLLLIKIIWNFKKIYTGWCLIHMTR